MFYMRQWIAWIYGSGKTGSHLAIYPRDSIWKSAIFASFSRSRKFVQIVILGCLVLELMYLCSCVKKILDMRHIGIVAVFISITSSPFVHNNLFCRTRLLNSSTVQARRPAPTAFVSALKSFTLFIVLLLTNWFPTQLKFFYLLTFFGGIFAVLSIMRYLCTHIVRIRVHALQ